MVCPCHSGALYETCCKPFHRGENPKTAVELMRSRYAAYALGLAEYIIATTHKKNPQYLPDTKQWKKEVEQFSKMTTFETLTILDDEENGENAIVTFRAGLTQNGCDISFLERSQFVNENGRWLYRNGEVSNA